MRARHRRGPGTARRIAAVTVTALIVLTGLGTSSATAAEEPLEWSTTLTWEETVTVTETVTIDGYVGHGEATATASATATGTATAATWWEVYYWAVMDAYDKASAQAKSLAEAEARPIARERAEADARAKANAGPQLIEWSTTWTQEETVTVTETVTIDGYEGHGTATATASATATGTATATTWWEVYYWAVMDAYEKASAQAKSLAEAEARPIARERAEADARAKADAEPELIEWSTTWTQEETVTVTESYTIGEFTGYGTATATASATATGTATATTWWEVYYWAFQDAYDKARTEALELADAEARALALERAQADAQAQVDAAPDPDDPDPDDPDPDPETPPPGPSCGPEILKPDGTPWQCTFVDGFSGNTLDTNKWMPVETSTTAFGGGDCFVSENVSVEGGMLRLATKRLDEPVTCDHPTLPLTSHYTSASVSTFGKFSQTYGRFEIRAAMPQTNGPGLHSAIWMTPAEPTYYGSWPLSGEIDIVEFFSANADRLIPALHYNSLAPWSERTNNHCLVHTPTAFHIYTLEWTQQILRISIDGSTCLEHVISPLAPLLGSAPFNRPFNINLTQGLGVAPNTLPEGAEIGEPTLLIDYVRVWS